MNLAIDLMERGLLPDWLVRIGIRHLCRRRLQEEERGSGEANTAAKMAFVEILRKEPVAVHTDTANEQHYELPAAFFRLCLGPRLKYSCCYWPEGVDTLAAAEEASLDQVCQRAELADGMKVLELGCGWGSLSLWMAQRYPQSRILAVSNSSSQRRFIEARRDELGLGNLDVLTADARDLRLDHTFDRAVSIEMFEHMRNYRTLLARIAGWLAPGGKLFVHHFSHRAFAYPYEAEGDGNWMGRHFFTGGLMPSDDLLLHFQDNLALERRWRIDGEHYRRTCAAWLETMDRHRDDIMPVFRKTYGDEAERWFRRWRVFHMACGEMFGIGRGREWGVSHYRFVK